MNILDARARDAKAKSAFYAGSVDRHPHGQSGLRFILPMENSRNFWSEVLEYAETHETNGLLPADFRRNRMSMGVSYA
jgi:hypothetical protein